MKEEVSRFRIQFWHVIVTVGCILVIGGLLLVFIRPTSGDSGNVTIRFLGIVFEGNDVGLAIIALGIVCFIIGNKGRTMQKYLDTTGKVVMSLATKFGVSSLKGSDPHRREGIEGTRPSDRKKGELKKQISIVQEISRKKAIDYVAIQEAAKVLKLADELDAEN